MKVFESYVEQDTWNFAKQLGQNARPGQIYCLIGDLGVGKTIFSKGFAEGLEIQEHITSPTFTIVNEYEGRCPLYHFDVYRITDIDEMYEIGYEEYFEGEGVCLIEWANVIPEIIPDDAKWITIEKDLSVSLDYRKIIIN